VPLGVDRFGQSGDIADLYRVYGLDRDAIIDAAARACLRAMPARPTAAAPKYDAATSDSALLRQSKVR